MPETTDKAPYQIIWLIRRLFRALAQESAKNLEGLSISVADRAVMEFLYPEKKLSVPMLAEQYKVSRQHVQATVNALLAQGLVETQDNPRHKRSPYIMLNDKGRMLFEHIMQKDEETLKALFAHLEKHDVQITLKTLQFLLKKLD